MSNSKQRKYFAIVKFKDRKVHIVLSTDIKDFDCEHAKAFDPKRTYSVVWQEAESKSFDGYFDAHIMLLAASLPELKLRAQEEKIKLPSNFKAMLDKYGEESLGAAKISKGASVLKNAKIKRKAPTPQEVEAKKARVLRISGAIAASKAALPFPDDPASASKKPSNDPVDSPLDVVENVSLPLKKDSRGEYVEPRASSQPSDSDSSEASFSEILKNNESLKTENRRLSRRVKELVEENENLSERVEELEKEQKQLLPVACAAEKFLSDLTGSEWYKSNASTASPSPCCIIPQSSPLEEVSSAKIRKNLFSDMSYDFHGDDDDENRGRNKSPTPELFEDNPIEYKAPLPMHSPSKELDSSYPENMNEMKTPAQNSGPADASTSSSSGKKEKKQKGEVTELMRKVCDLVKLDMSNKQKLPLDEKGRVIISDDIKINKDKWYKTIVTQKKGSLFVKKLGQAVYGSEGLRVRTVALPGKKDKDKKVATPTKVEAITGCYLAKLELDEPPSVALAERAVAEARKHLSDKMQDEARKT